MAPVPGSRVIHSSGGEPPDEAQAQVHGGLDNWDGIRDNIQQPGTDGAVRLTGPVPSL